MCEIILPITLDHKNTVSGVESFSRLQKDLKLFSTSDIWGPANPPVIRVGILLRCETFRAMHRNRSVGRPVVLGVRLDRFDHRVAIIVGMV